MANQNFRVGVSVDLSSARRALRRLESEFQDISIDFGGVGRASRELENLDRSITRIGRSFNQVDRAFSNFNSKVDRNRGAVRQMVQSFNRLERETRGVRGQLADLGNSLDRIRRGFAGTIRAVSEYDARVRALGGSGNPFATLNADLRRFTRELRETDFPLDQVADGLQAISRSVRALDRSFERLNPAQRRANFESLARGVRDLRQAMGSSDDEARRLSEEIRDLAQAARAADRATTGLVRAQERQFRVGRAARAAGRSSATPAGFIGGGGALGFLGIGGVGARFAVSAGAIAAITTLGFGIAEASRRTTEFVAETAKLSAEFDLLIRRANILAGGEALAPFSEAALEQGKRTIFTAAEAAESLGELARAGFETQEAIAALPGVLDLAASDEVALADASLIVARTLRGFRLEASDASIVADTLAQTAAASAVSTQELAQSLKFVTPIAAVLGFQVQEVSAALGVLGDNGVVAGIAGRALRFALASLLSPTPKAAKALKELGLETRDAQGNFVGLRSIVDQLAEAQGRLGDEAEFAGLVFDAFGKRATNSILLLVENSDLLRERTAENFLAVGRAAEIANEQLAGLEGALERLRGEFETQRIEAFRTTGIQEQLSALVREIDLNLGTVFTNIVDPLFGEIGAGVNRLRVETFPQLLEATEPVGEQIGETIQSVFDFITSNDDEIIAAILALSNAIGGLIDVFLGLGEIGATVFSPLIDGFNALNDTAQASLTGAGLGAALGTVFGGLPGAVIGAGAGGLIGAIGASFGDENLQQQVADFGVQLGIEISDGIAEGLDFAEAVNTAIRNTEQTNVQDFEGLVIARDVAEAEVQDFARSLNEALGLIEKENFEEAFSIFEDLDLSTPSQRDLTLPFFDLLDETVEAERVLASLEEQAFLTSGAVDQVVGNISNAQAIAAEIARARAIQQRLTDQGQGGLFTDTSEIGPGQGVTGIRVIEDPETILRNILAGNNIPALARDGVALPLEEANEIIASAAENFSAAQSDNAVAIASGLSELTRRTLESLQATRDSLSAIDFGGFIFSGVPDIQEEALGVLVGDFADVFQPVSAEEKAAAAEAAADAIQPTIESARSALIERLASLPDGVAEEVRPLITGIFEDDGLTLFEQSLAGAFLIDQEFLNERAQEMTDAIETIFARVDELATERPQLPNVANFLPQDDIEAAFDIEGTVVRQQEILRNFVATGQLSLGVIAATSDGVLAAIAENSLELDALETNLQGIVEQQDFEIGLILSDPEVQAVQQQLEDLFGQLEGTGEDVVAGIDSSLSDLPQSFLDPVEQGVNDVLGFLETGSPSKLFGRIGKDVVDGLGVGWRAAFPSLRTLILTDLAQLVEAIRATLSRTSFDITTPNVNAPGSTTTGRPILHGGGFVPGNSEIMAKVLGGEFMLRRSAVKELSSLGVSLEALNRDPRSYFDPIMAKTQVQRSTTYDHSRNPSYSTTHHYEIKTTANLNERRLMREAERRFTRNARRGL